MDLHRGVDHELEGERDDDQVEELGARREARGGVHGDLRDVKPANGALRELEGGNEKAKRDEKDQVLPLEYGPTANEEEEGHQ